MTAKTWLLGAAVTMLVGCVPYPHTYQYLPPVEGTLREAGRPAVAVRVTLRLMPLQRKTSPCEAPSEADAVTDGQGHFTMKGERRVRLYILGVPMDGLESWGFCFERPDGSRAGWASPPRGHAGPRYAPLDMTVECDLAAGADLMCSMSAGPYGKLG